jgi:hypothetical protein
MKTALSIATGLTLALALVTPAPAMEGRTAVPVVQLDSSATGAATHNF